MSTFEVADDEPAPDVKRAAVGFLETTFNYEAGQGTAEAARGRLNQAGMSAEAITDGLFPGVEDTAGAAQIVYPQLGGLTDDQASIMAITRITTLSGDSLGSVTRVIDVRLTRDEQDWEVTEIASMGGDLPAGATETPWSSPEASHSPEGDGPADRVLGSEDIDLPDSSRWDIEEGGIDERVLALLLELSDEHTLSVAVLATGHPVNVFNRSSVSNHTQGRAVDIWAIDGVSVSDHRRAGPDGPAGSLMRSALEQGATEVGGPWALSTEHGDTFTDTVHEDHLHIGFKQ
ncbi:hypothetical protein ABZ249_16460 [Nocardiopsis sp. NPDC006139]|uniref:hypothetical protein n=1 Tax=Nocardiopsis sp. NPDC006139 TaxID=3154578 RepID=UPI0033B1C4D3